MRRGTRLGLAAAGLALGVLYRRTRLPKPTASRAPATTEGGGDTYLGRAIAALVADHPGSSGVHALPDGREAFAARIALAERAERTLDVQYYIWEKDLSGTLLFDALRRAADRGVRVRLLLDDNETVGLDATLAALEAHRHIEVRLYNPFVLRKARVLGFAMDFRRLNRRMHNKAFVADRQAAVIGGRNIGDRYFQAARGSLFMDMDVLAIGPVVSVMADEFERYWASASAFAAATVLPAVDAAEIERLKHEAARVTSDPAARDYLHAVRSTDFVADLLAQRLSFDWAEIRLLSDDPAKTLGKPGAGGLLIDHLHDALGDPQREIGLVSGYFVPTRHMVAVFAAMARRGVAVRIVTNALDATDVKVVVAGYAKWRKPLLAAGIRLYEIRGAVAGKEPHTRGGVGGSVGGGSIGGSASGSVLHAKTFTVDRERVFVGSFNLDPRSARLNTEQGLVIRSPALAAHMADALAERLPDIAYEVRLDPDGRLYWLEEQDGDAIRHDAEPGTTRLERTVVRLLSHLPIDWLL